MIIKKYKSKSHGYGTICRCDYCEREFRRHSCQSEKTETHFCDKNCQKKYQVTITGDKHNCWKGGRLTSHSRGYIRTYNPEHPQTDSLGYVYEHRLVVEERIGRYLENQEDVHHINGNTSDNRSENLELLPHGEHCSRNIKLLRRDNNGRVMKSV